MSQVHFKDVKTGKVTEATEEGFRRLRKMDKEGRYQLITPTNSPERVKEKGNVKPGKETPSNEQPDLLSQQP